MYIFLIRSSKFLRVQSILCRIFVVFCLPFCIPVTFSSHLLYHAWSAVRSVGQSYSDCSHPHSSQGLMWRGCPSALTQHFSGLRVISGNQNHTTVTALKSHNSYCIVSTLKQVTDLNRGTAAGSSAGKWGSRR